MKRLDLILAFAATLAAGALYAVHPDDTSRTVLVGAGTAFLALVRPGSPPLTTPATSTKATTATPATADPYVELPSA